MARIECRGPLHYLQIHNLLTKGLWVINSEAERLKEMVGGQSVRLMSGPGNTIAEVTAADINWHEKGYSIHRAGPAYSVIVNVDNDQADRVAAAIWVTVGEKQIIRIDGGEEEEARQSVRRLLL